VLPISHVSEFPVAEEVDRVLETAADIPEALRTKFLRWWFVEAWFKLRPSLIAFVVEGVLFGLFLVGLEGMHRLVDRTSLSPTERQLLHKFHFYSHVVVLGIFGLGFIIQAAFRVWEDILQKDELAR